MTRPHDPSVPGPHTFDAVIYATAGNNYAAVPPLALYVVYDNPDPDYVTGTIDISDFANLGSAPWPFPNTAVPINGQLRVPHGHGPFPLVLFAHGNHDPLVDSTPGYICLCELLASHSIIAGTIDVNFLNGWELGRERRARDRPSGAPEAVPGLELDRRSSAGWQDRPHPRDDLANPTVSDGRPKGLLWVYKADHNQFNSVWPPEWSPAPVLPRAEQEKIAKVYIGSLAQAKLLDHDEYEAVLKDHAAAHAWLPPLTLCISQYQDPQRIFVQHEQEGPGFPQISLPVQGVVLADSVAAARGLFDLANTFGPQFTYTLQLNWNAVTAKLLMNIDPTTCAANRYKVLSFRAGQSVDPANAMDRDQDFTLEVSTAMRTYAARVSSFHRLLYPDTAVSAGKIVMQTIRVPLDALADRGVDPADIRTITLSLDRRPSGSIYIGDVQFSG